MPRTYLPFTDCLRPGEQVDLKILKGKLYDWVKEQVSKEKQVSTISRAA